MSFTITVPVEGAVTLPQFRAVGSSFACKKSAPFTFVRLIGPELVDPPRMSLTSPIPPAVPSLLHNSAPFVLSSRRKEYAVHVGQRRRRELPEPTTMSLTITVPAAVPLLFHSSIPLAPSRRQRRAFHLHRLFVRIRARAPGVDVLHADRPRRCPVGLRQLDPARAIGRAEEERGADHTVATSGLRRRVFVCAS